MIKRLLFALFLTGFAAVNLQAQAKTSDSTVVPLSVIQPYFQTNFIKQSITWNWQSHFLMHDSSYYNNSWLVSDQFSSNIIAPGSVNEQLKDEHRFEGRFKLNRPLISPGIYLKSWYQQDKQTTTNNKFANHAAGLFLDTHYLQPYLGYQQSRNRDLIENGWDLGLLANPNAFQLENYRARFNYSGDFDIYERRKNNENRLQTSIDTRFGAYSGDSLQFALEEVKKQYYVAGKLEEVSISNRTWFNRLFYYITPRDRLTLQSQIQSRKISYFNGRELSNFSNNLVYTHLGRDLYLQMQIRTADETQNNSGVSTDSRSRQTALRLQTAYNFTARQRLNLDFGYAKLQYDTPDDRINFDDRDELRFALRADYSFNVNPFLQLQVAANSFLFRQLYIYAEQSSNNNWNRIFRLNPRIVYNSGGIRNKLNTEVLANYTVYDFDEFLGQTRSFVFRKYVLSDSLLIHLKGRIHGGSYIRLELEDKGSFFEKDFSQLLLQSYRSEYYNLFLLNEYFLRFRTVLGYSYYRRNEWRHIPVKKRSRRLVNQGPFITLVYRQSQQLQFSANVALSYLDDDAYRSSTYTTGNLRLYYLF